MKDIPALRRQIKRCQEPSIRAFLEMELEKAVAERTAAKDAAKAARDAERAATKARRKAAAQVAKAKCSATVVSPAEYPVSGGKGKYRVRTVGGKRLLAHRVALGLAAGDKQEVHHVDHDVENNSPMNLKTMSHQQNCNLRRKRKGTTSRYIGGSWDKSRGKWKFRIKLKDGTTKHLGYFDSEEDGRDAYNRAAVKEYGLAGKTLNDSSRASGTVWDIIEAVAQDTEYLFGQVHEAYAWTSGRTTVLVNRLGTLRDTRVMSDGILSQAKGLEELTM